MEKRTLASTTYAEQNNVQGHYLSSRSQSGQIFFSAVSSHVQEFLMRSTLTKRLDSVSVFRWNLLSWAQSIELVPICGHQHQHRIGYTPQAEDKSSARVKKEL
jgi:hypothetical protein